MTNRIPVNQPIATWQERAKLAGVFPCFSGDVVAKYVIEENEALRAANRELRRLLGYHNGY